MKRQFTSMPIQPEVRRQMQTLAQFFDDALPDGYGFALLVFDLGDGGFMNYISNAERDDMKRALRELVDKMEKEGN